MAQRPAWYYSMDRFGRTTVWCIAIAIGLVVWGAIASNPGKPKAKSHQSQAACEPEGRRFVEAWTAYENGDGDETDMNDALDDLKAVAPTEVADAIDTVQSADTSSVLKSDQANTSDAALILDGWLDDCGFVLPT